MFVGSGDETGDGAAAFRTVSDVAGKYASTLSVVFVVEEKFGAATRRVADIHLGNGEGSAADRESTLSVVIVDAGEELRAGAGASGAVLRNFA